MAKVPNLKRKNALSAVLPKNIRRGEIAPFRGFTSQHNAVDNPVETVHNFDFAGIFGSLPPVMLWRKRKDFPHFSGLCPKNA